VSGMLVVISFIQEVPVTLYLGKTDDGDITLADMFVSKYSLPPEFKRNVLEQITQQRNYRQQQYLLAASRQQEDERENELQLSVQSKLFPLFVMQIMKKKSMNVSSPLFCDHDFCNTRLTMCGY
jgi:hypothetical protein